MASSRLRHFIGRTFKLAAPLLVLAVAVLVLMYLLKTRPEPPPAKPEQRVWQVEQITINPQALRPKLTAYGEVTATDTITYRAPLAGVITERAARDGARVSQGDLLLKMDPRDVQPPLDRAQSRLDELESQHQTLRVEHQQDLNAIELERAIVRNAQNALERNRSLLERNHASDSDVESARDALTQARLSVTNRQQRIDSFESRLKAIEAQIKAARADVNAAERDAERASIYAPADGVISSVAVAAGDRANANDELLRFYQTEHLELHATLPNRYAIELRDALHRGQPITAESMGAGVSRALTLVRIAGQARGDGVTGIFEFNNGADIRPGEIQAINITRPPIDNVVALPYSAIYGNNLIYRITADNLLERIPVEVLGSYPFNGERGVVVRSDALQAGNEIAITHLPNAIDGLAVQPVTHDDQKAEKALEVSP